jgi:hypothetical protein
MFFPYHDAFERLAFCSHAFIDYVSHMLMNSRHTSSSDPLSPFILYLSDCVETLVSASTSSSCWPSFLTLTRTATGKSTSMNSCPAPLGTNKILLFKWFERCTPLLLRSYLYFCNLCCYFRFAGTFRITPDCSLPLLMLLGTRKQTKRATKRATTCPRTSKI